MLIWLWFLLSMQLHVFWGYGNIYPCTDGGKLFTVFYALLGIPLALLVLDNLGKMFASYVNFAWIQWRCFCCFAMKSLKKSKGKVTNVSPTAPQLNTWGKRISKTEILPVWIGLPITVLWVLFSAGCFVGLENDMSFGDSVYFMFVSVMTVGFGDVVPQRFEV